MLLISDKDIVDLLIDTLDGKCSKKSLDAYRKHLEKPNVLNEFKRNFMYAMYHIIYEQVKKWGNKNPDYIKAMAKTAYVDVNDGGTVTKFKAMWFNSSDARHRGLTSLCAKEQSQSKKIRQEIYEEIENLLVPGHDINHSLLINELLAYNVGEIYLMPNKTTRADLTELYTNALDALIVDNKPQREWILEQWSR